MNPQPAPVSRRHDLDALRVFACYLLFLFHVGMVFSPAPFFHVRNGDSNFVFFIICGFISLWHMPLFFLLAGWSAAASLRSRGMAEFLRERWGKLAVPLVAGCVLLVPGIKYLELRSGLDLNHRGLRVDPELQARFQESLSVELPLMSPFDQSFLEFLPAFFTQLDRFSWSHLWFLAYLLTLTVVLLPLFSGWLRRASGSTTPGRGWVYAPILPLMLIQLLLRQRFPGPYNLYDDWASVAYYATYLICGFALAVHPALGAPLQAERHRLLGLGIASVGVLLAGALGLFDWAPLMLAGSAVAGWCFVGALLTYARTNVVRSSRRLEYLAESAFPIYWLHQPVVVVLAFGIVRLPLGIVPKFVLLLSGSIAVTLAIYHFALRPFGPTRFLVGMKPRRGARRAVPLPLRPGPVLGGR
jgi:fucose 4-O-acetylase-like acetyltransferase